MGMIGLTNLTCDRPLQLTHLLINIGTICSITLLDKAKLIPALPHSG